MEKKNIKQPKHHSNNPQLIELKTEKPFIS